MRIPRSTPYRSLASGLALVGAGVAVAMTAGVLSAQQPPVFSLRTDLVQLDVMVGDTQGRHVSGLTKDDFEIYVAGKRLDVAVLAENRNPRPVTLNRAPARHDVASNETIQRDRIIMLVLDDVHIRRESTEYQVVAYATPPLSFSCTGSWS